MRINYFNASLVGALLLLSGCASVYWHFPPGGTQQDFARDEYECLYSTTTVYQPQSQQQTVVVQQNNTYGNNTAVVNGNTAPSGFAGGMAESLSNSLASMPQSYTNPNMYKLCMQSKGYVQGQKP